MTIGIGLGMPQLGPHITRKAVTSFCRRAEELGFASMWVQEHLFYPTTNNSGYAGRQSTEVHPAYKSILGSTELISFAAACTEQMMIGTSILVAGYHRPVELAQRIATIDLLSGGRFVPGLAAGWSTEEHQQMDVDTKTRGRRMDELIEAMRACWAQDPISFDGEFFSIPQAIMLPKPVQQPHPPLLSGLKSEVGLKRTAKYFDIWNPSRGTADELLEQLDFMAGLRPEGKDALRLFYRAYTQRPTDPVGGGGQGIDGVLRDLDTAIAAGAEQLIIDTSFGDDMDSEAAWEQVPDLLAPVLEAARSHASAGAES